MNFFRSEYSQLDCEVLGTHSLFLVMKHCQAMSGDLELHIEEKSMKQKHLGGLEKYKDHTDNSESLFFLCLNDKTE